MSAKYFADLTEHTDNQLCKNFYILLLQTIWKKLILAVILQWISKEIWHLLRGTP